MLKNAYFLPMIAKTFDGIVQMLMGEPASDRDRVNEVLHWLGGVSARQIEEIAHLTRARRTAALDSLIDEGWVAPSDGRMPTGGRKAIIYRLNPDRGLVIGIDIEPGSATILVTNAARDVLADAQCPLTPNESPGGSMARVSAQLLATISAIGRDPEGVIGIGLSLPGTVDPRTGELINAPGMASWAGFSVGEHLRADFPNARTIAINDANAMILQELAILRQRSGRIGNESLIVIKMGPNGLGAGMVDHGLLLEGSRGAAGEIGHIVVDPDGISCGCGRRGCLETVAGPQGMVRRAEEGARDGASPILAEAVRRNGGGLTLDDVVQAGRAGDEFANSVIIDAGARIGAVVADLVNIMNPDRIIVGGRLSSIGASILAAIRQQVYGRASLVSTGQLAIEFSELGEKASLWGAALVAQRTAYMIAE